MEPSSGGRHNVPSAPRCHILTARHILLSYEEAECILTNTNVTIYVWNRDKQPVLLTYLIWHLAANADILGHACNPKRLDNVLIRDLRQQGIHGFETSNLHLKKSSINLKGVWTNYEIYDSDKIQLHVDNFCRTTVTPVYGTANQPWGKLNLHKNIHSDIIPL